MQQPSVLSADSWQAGVVAAAGDHRPYLAEAEEAVVVPPLSRLPLEVEEVEEVAEAAGRPRRPAEEALVEAGQVLVAGATQVPGLL